MTRSGLSACLFLSCAILSTPVLAEDWKVDKQHSKVGIVGKKDKASISGTINKWDGKIQFDPQHLDTSHVLINVDVGSIRTSDRQWDTILPNMDWLAAKAFPMATFESTNISHVSGNEYQAAGTLTIRGIRQNVALPFTVEMANQTARAQGVLTLVRTDFGIGGITENVPEYAVTVGVTFDLTATK